MQEVSVSPLESYSNPIVTIERARPEDAEAIADIQRRTWLDTYPNGALGITEEDIRINLDGPNGENVSKRVERWRQRLEAGIPDSATFVARVDGRVLGYTSPHIPAGQHRVGSLYVLPEAQGMGVGYQPAATKYCMAPRTRFCCSHISPCSYL